MERVRGPRGLPVVLPAMTRHAHPAHAQQDKPIRETGGQNQTNQERHLRRPLPQQWLPPTTTTTHHPHHYPPPPPTRRTEKGSRRAVAAKLHGLQLRVGPLVELSRADKREVDAKAPVRCRAVQADVNPVGDLSDQGEKKQTKNKMSLIQTTDPHNVERFRHQVCMFKSSSLHTESNSCHSAIIVLRPSPSRLPPSDSF